jgi:hypothetical protein
MTTSASKIGRATIVFEPTELDIDLDRDPELTSGDDYGVVEHSGKIADAYGQLKAILQDVSDDLGNALAARGSDGLSSVAVEFALSFSGEANVWVVKAGGQGSVKATLVWDLKRPT